MYLTISILVIIFAVLFGDKIKSLISSINSNVDIRESILEYYFPGKLNTNNPINSYESAIVRERNAIRLGVLNLLIMAVIGTVSATIASWLISFIIPTSFALSITFVPTLIYVVYMSYKIYTDMRKGTTLIIPHNTLAVVTIGGERFKILMKEGTHETLKFVLPFNILGNFFRISALPVTLRYLTFDEDVEDLMSRDRASMFSKMSVGIKSTGRLDDIFKRSGYTEGQIKAGILDQLTTGLSIAFSNLNSVEMSDYGQDTVNGITGGSIFVDRINQEWHGALNGSDVNDLEFYITNNNASKNRLYHKEYGVIVEPLLKGRNYTHKETAMAMEAEAIALAEKAAVNVKKDVIADLAAAVQKVFQLSDREARNTVLIMMNEYKEESIQDFGGFSGISDIPPETITNFLTSMVEMLTKKLAPTE